MRQLTISFILFGVVTITGLACAGERPARRPDGGSPADEKTKTATPVAGKKHCRSHSDCPSGVCSHYKADNGFCAPETCRAGARADNNHFYCTEAGSWQKSRAAGEACAHDYECFQPTCFMNPNCDAMPKRRARCTAGRCTLQDLPDDCTAQGKVRVLAPEEFWGQDEGRCTQSMAQRVLRTVCVPCGNGRCDENESICNCPEDCKKN